MKELRTIVFNSNLCIYYSKESNWRNQKWKQEHYGTVQKIDKAKGYIKPKSECGER